MYDMYPDWGPANWGPAKHDPENPHNREAVPSTLDQRDSGSPRPDDN